MTLVRGKRERLRLREREMSTFCLASQLKCQVQRQGMSYQRVGKSKPSFISRVKPVLQELEKLAMNIDLSNAMKTVSLAALNAFVDSTVQFVDQPLLHSQRNFGPVEEIGESVGVDCAEGEIPADFPEGAYLRNGANPLFGGLKSAVSVLGRTDHVWVEGHGMIHALYFTKDASGNWSTVYNNRFVESETFKMEKQRGKPTFLPAIEGDPLAVLAALSLNMMRFGMGNNILSNTNVFEHGEKYYSVAENFVPQEIDILNLETFCNWDVNGAWDRPFTSHPKKAPGTGELVITGVDAEKPYCVLGIISADGMKLTHKVDLKMEKCTVLHDFGVTERYNILLDHPLTIDPNRLSQGEQLIKLEKGKKSRIGVMPRYGDADSVKWFDVEPYCTYHLINCYEDGDEIVVRGCRSHATIIPGPDWGEDKFDWFSRGFKPIPRSSKGNNTTDQDQGMLFSRVHEWKLNMETGAVEERDITGTDISMDFPVINEKFAGLKNKYGYMQVIDSAASSSCGKSKYGGLAKLYFEEQGSNLSVDGVDESAVHVEYHNFPKNNYCTGSAFVGKNGGSEEDDGWIVTFVHDEDTDLSHVLIVDAKKFEGPPVAKVRLPQRVPYGHHGAFFHAPAGQH